jgi:hypothetical protein
MCQMTISFIPKNKKSYNIIFYAEKTENSLLENIFNKQFDKCYVGVGEFVNNKLVRVNVKHIDNIVMKRETASITLQNTNHWKFYGN